MPVKMFTLVSLSTLMKIQYLKKGFDMAWIFTILSILKSIPHVCSSLLCYVDN